MKNNAGVEPLRRGGIIGACPVDGVDGEGCCCCCCCEKGSDSADREPFLGG